MVLTGVRDEAVACPVVPAWGKVGTGGPVPLNENY